MKRLTAFGIQAAMEPRAVADWGSANEVLYLWPDRWDEVALEPTFVYDDEAKTSEYVGMAYHFFKARKVVTIAVRKASSLLVDPLLRERYEHIVTRSFERAGLDA